MLLQFGAHPKVVAERLGHASPDVTTRLYSHMTPGLEGQAASDLDGYLYGKSGPDLAPAASRNSSTGSENGRGGEIRTRWGG